MIIHKGSDRVVLAFPNQGFVIKVPLIKIFRAVHYFCGDFFARKWSSLRKRFIHPIRMQYSIPGLVFRGIFANWNEFLLYQQTKNPFLQPTYFSFFGLFNIQKHNEPYKDGELLRKEIYRIIGWRGFKLDMHHLVNPRNFTLEKGRLRILDYGSKSTRTLIEEFGKRIHEEFNVG